MAEFATVKPLDSIFSQGNAYEQLLPIENALISNNAYKDAINFAEDAMARD